MFFFCKTRCLFLCRKARAVCLCPQLTPFVLCSLLTDVSCDSAQHFSTSLSTCLFVRLLPLLGLSPDLQSMEQIRRIMRPTDVPDQGLLCDLLWSDPDKDVLGWGENDRGVSFTFGSEVVAKFLHKHDLDLICRAHQVTTRTHFFSMCDDTTYMYTFLNPRVRKAFHIFT